MSCGLGKDFVVLEVAWYVQSVQRGQSPDSVWYPLRKLLVSFEYDLLNHDSLEE